MNIPQMVVIGIMSVVIVATLALALVQSLTVFAQLVSELSPLVVSSTANTP